MLRLRWSSVHTRRAWPHSSAGRLASREHPPKIPSFPTSSVIQAFICDAVRTPFGRYGDSLSSVRTDDFGAVPLPALNERNKNVDWQAGRDLLYGRANQAGEDNRNVARMSALLAGLPLELGGATINRLCGSGLANDKERKGEDHPK